MGTAGEGGPPPSRTRAQVPRSRTAVPAAPRSTPPAPAASGAPCDRISLSLFPADGAAAAAAAAAPARRQQPWPRAPSPPGRSPSLCSSPGCRPRRPGGSGRTPARRRCRPHRPPRCCPSPPTCPRARQPECCPEEGRRSARGASSTSARAAACEGLARTCSARRARPAAGLLRRPEEPRRQGGGGAGTTALKTPRRAPSVQPGGGSGAWQARGRSVGTGRGGANVCAQTRAAPALGTREGTRGGLVPGSGAAAGPLRRRSRPLLLETGKRCPRQPRAHEPRRLCPAPRRRGDPREGDPREGDAGTAGKPSNEGVRLSTFSSELGEVSPSLLAPPQAPHAFLVLPPPFSDRGKNRRGDVCANSRRP